MARKYPQWQDGHLLIPLADVWRRGEQDRIDEFDVAVEIWREVSKQFRESGGAAQHMDNYDPGLAEF